MEDKDWSPEDESDPIELQKKQIALGERFLKKIEEKEKLEAEKRAEIEEALTKARAAPRGVIGGYTNYQPPTFEEMSGMLLRAWTETRKIASGAPDHIKEAIFQSLLSTCRAYPAGPPVGG